MGKRKRRYSDTDDEELLHKLTRRLERRNRRHSKRKRKYYDDYDYDSDYRYEPEYEDEPCREPERIYGSDSDEHSLRSIVSVPNPPKADDRSQDNPDVILPAQDEAAPGTSSGPPELPKEILELLGDSKEKEEVFGPKIQEEVSKRWGKIIMEGLSKEQKQKVVEEVLIPENFQLLKAPKLNPEISAVISESTRNRDKRLEKAQNHLGLGIAAITNLMTSLIDGVMEKQDVIKKLSEAGQLLLDLHNQETITRRQLITYSLDKKFLNMVRDVKRDSFLFGVNLGEKIKASKSAEKSGLQIKRRFEPQPSTSTYRSNRPTTLRQLNSTRGLPRHYAQRGRAGGPRTQIPSHMTRRHQAMAERYNSSAKLNNKPQPPQTRKTP